MNKTLLALIGIGGIGAILLLVLGISCIGSYNGAATLRNSYEIKLKDNESQFDLMYKKIAQAAQLPAAKKDAFREIYTSYATARTNQSQQQLMTWIKESAPPNPDLSIYDKVLNIIMGSRDSFAMRQRELLGIAEEYNRRLSVLPGNFILPMMGFTKIDPKVISSGHTKEVFATGEDNEVELKLK